MNEKRIISLGLEKPLKLKEDIIYIDFNRHKGEISAQVYSNEKFGYHKPTTINKGEKIFTKQLNSRWYLDWQANYKIIITDLVKSNNGKINYHRLIEDSSMLVTKILNIKQEISDINI